MSIRKVLLDILQYQLFISLTVLNVTILFIVNLFLIVLDIQILCFNISYNSCFSNCLVLFVRFYCISHLLESTNLFSLVLLLGRIFLSAIDIRPFYLRNHYISSSSKLFLSAHCISYQVVYIKQQYHALVLSFLSPFGIR